MASKPMRIAHALTMHTRSFSFNYACESCTVNRRATLRRRARDFSFSKHNRSGIRHHATRLLGIEFSSRRRDALSAREYISRVYICTYGRHVAACIYTHIHDTNMFSGIIRWGVTRRVRHVPGEQIDNMVHVTRTTVSVAL